MPPEMGPPERIDHEFHGADASWIMETKDFINEITNGEVISTNIDDAIATFSVIDSAYNWGNK